MDHGTAVLPHLSVVNLRIDSLEVGGGGEELEERPDHVDDGGRRPRHRGEFVERGHVERLQGVNRLVKHGERVAFDHLCSL